MKKKLLFAGLIGLYQSVANAMCTPTGVNIEKCECAHPIIENGHLACGPTYCPTGTTCMPLGNCCKTEKVCGSLSTECCKDDEICVDGISCCPNDKPYLDANGNCVECTTNDHCSDNQTCDENGICTDSLCSNGLVSVNVVNNQNTDVLKWQDGGVEETTCCAKGQKGYCQTTAPGDVDSLGNMTLTCGVYACCDGTVHKRNDDELDFECFPTNETVYCSDLWDTGWCNSYASCAGTTRKCHDSYGNTVTICCSEEDCYSQTTLDNNYCDLGWLN